MSLLGTVCDQDPRPVEPGNRGAPGEALGRGGCPPHGLHRTASPLQAALLGLGIVSRTLPNRVNQKFWNVRELSLLGTCPDRDVAQTLGISPQTVWMKRRELGIPPYGEPPRTVLWTAEELALLGKVADKRIAEQKGVHAVTVAKKREELGIPRASRVGERQQQRVREHPFGGRGYRSGR